MGFNGAGQAVSILPRSGTEDALIAIRNGATSANGGASQLFRIRQGGRYELTYYIAAPSLLGETVFTAQGFVNGKKVSSGSLASVTAGLPADIYKKQSAQVTLRAGTAKLSIQGAVSSAPFDLALLVLDDVSLTFLHGLSIDFRNLGLTYNERNVANGLFTATSKPGAQQGTLFNGLSNVSNGAAPAVLDSLSGEGITATQNLAFRSAQLFNSAIFDQTTFYGSGSAGNSITLTDTPPASVALASDGQEQRQPIHELADLPSASHQLVMPVLPNRTWRAWGTGFGASEDIHGNGTIGSAEQNNTIYGGVLGVDYQLMPNYLVGIALGGSSGRFSVPGRTTSGSTDGGHIAFYDLAKFGPFYGASSTSFSYYSNGTTRFVSGFGGLGGETERSNFGSDQFRTRLEFGRHLDGLGLGAFGSITPFVALEIAQLRSNGFNESSITGPGNFCLNVSGQSIASAPGYVGARFQRLTPIGGGLVFSPTLQLAYIHEFAPERSQIGTLVDLPGSTFLVDGARPSRNAGEAKVGGELKVGATSVIFVNFDDEFSGVDQLYAGKGGFRYLW